MMRPSFTLAAAAVCLFAGAARAQVRPDFSGIWVRGAEGAPTVATAGDAAFRTGDMGSGLGTPLTITQRADSLVLEYVFFAAYDLQPPVRFAYAIDGSESTNSITLSHATSVQRARVTWKDSSVVIVTRHAAPREVGAPGNVVEVRQTLTLSSPTAMVVATTRPGANGAPVTIQQTYTRR